MRYCKFVTADQGRNCPTGYTWGTVNQVMTGRSWYTGSEGHRCGYQSIEGKFTDFHRGTGYERAFNVYATDRQMARPEPSGSNRTMNNIRGGTVWDSQRYSGQPVAQTRQTWNETRTSQGDGSFQMGYDACVSNITGTSGALVFSYGSGITTTEPVEYTGNSSQYLTASNGAAPYSWQLVLTDFTYTNDIATSDWSVPGGRYAGAVLDAYCGHNPVSTKLEVSQTKNGRTSRLEMCNFNGQSGSAGSLFLRTTGAITDGSTQRFYYKVRVRDANGNIYEGKRFHTAVN